MSNNLYEILWVSKNATKEEIKKAYKKQAMQHHPDRNKWDKSSEEKFKQVNEAYSVLSDDKKRKQYDTFWSAWSNPFSSWAWNPFWWSAWYSWFEDIFSNMWGSSQKSNNFEFDLEDLFWWFKGSGNRSRSSNTKRTQEQKEQKEESLDFEKTYEVPIFDLIIWCKIWVTWVYWQKAKLTIPPKTKPWTKFRVKDFWKSENTKKWNLIVKIDAKMPKNISDIDLQMLKTIRDNVWY